MHIAYCLTYEDYLWLYERGNAVIVLPLAYPIDNYQDGVK